MRSRQTATTFVGAALCALALTSPALAGDGEQPTLITDPQLLVSLGFKPDAGNVCCTTTEDLQVVGITDRLFRTQLDIPNGARLQAVRWWASDSSPTQDMLLEVLQVCAPNQGPGPPVPTVLGTQSTSGSSGNQSGEILVDMTADTKACTYAMTVTFGTTGCTNSLQKVRVQWVRQVSPAPVTARFLDVPTNHPFFKFVEALAASGITGGCSANQYCPDAPVTRGQMAVFLATALGLNWGGL